MISLMKDWSGWYSISAVESREAAQHAYRQATVDPYTPAKWRPLAGRFTKFGCNQCGRWGRRRHAAPHSWFRVWVRSSEIPPYATR